MTIQIDDAGWGCLIGGVLIGAYRTETRQFTYGVVAPQFFQGERWDTKAYQAEGGAQIAACFEHLAVKPDEPIVVCTGYVLDGVCQWLAANGYKFQRGKITGPLQDQIEATLRDYLAAGFGFLTDCDLLTDPAKKGLFWWKQVQWLKGGNVNAAQPVPEREAGCKTGWATYRIWATNPYDKAKKLAKQFKQSRSRDRWRERRDDYD